MKKFLSFILALALLLGAACAAPGDANLGMNMNEKYSDSISGGAVVGDVLYLHGYTNLYSWKQGDADLTAHPYRLDQDNPESYQNLERVFSDGETLYGLFARYSHDPYTFESLTLREITIDGENVSFGDPMELATDELRVDYGDGSEYLCQINGVVCDGDYAYFQMYNADGYPAVYAMDMATGEGVFVDVKWAQSCCLYEDGALLIESYSYEDGGLEFFVYDPMSESLSSASSVIESDSYYNGLVYSLESGRLFYLDGGYVKACTDFDFENAQPVAELSMAMYSDSLGLLLPGDYYVSCTYEVTCVRSTNPDDLPETSIVVAGDVYNSSVSDSYYAFGNTHGDVAVVLSNNWVQDSDIIQSMMNRDSSIDIYIMQTNRQAYDSMYNRGYLAELDHPDLLAVADGMYPGVQRGVFQDDKLVAVPVTLFNWQLGLNYEGLEQLGFTREDVPTDWLGFIGFLGELADQLPDDGSVQLVESDWMTQRDLRDQLLSAVFQCYFDETTAMGETPDYALPELEMAMQAIMDFDFSVFGLAEDYEEMENGREIVWFNSAENRPTILMENSMGCTLGNFYSSWNCEPLLLTLRPGADPVFAVDMTVALINPFTQNYDLAQEFLVEMVKNMDIGTRYNISPELNEPRRYSWYEENLKVYQDMIDQQKAALETADPVDKPLIEESIAAYEADLIRMEEQEWEIAPRDIQWYRANAAFLSPKRYNHLESDPSGEVWNLMGQLYEGQIGVSEFLREVGKKARMMALEGA